MNVEKGDIMTKLLLIRHGESTANRRDVFAGQINPDLEEKGVRQAKITADYIASNFNVDKIYSSDLQRAYKTALCLSEIIDIEVVKDKNLREINGGIWENAKYSDLQSLYPSEFRVWLDNTGESYCPGGESVSQLTDRIMNALTKIAKENDNKTIAVFTHATPIRVAQTIIETGTLDEMKNIEWVSNASVTILSYDNDIWKIDAVSIDDHLKELKTFLSSEV